MHSTNPLFELADDIAATIFPAAALKVNKSPTHAVNIVQTYERTAGCLTALKHGARISFDGVDAGLYAPPADPTELFIWPSNPIRRRTAFIYAVMSFVSELISLDAIQRHLYKDKADLQEMSNLVRRELLMTVWRGTSVGSYSPLDITSTNWRTRLPCVLALYEVMSVWPHVELPGVDKIDSEEEFAVLEKIVWQQLALAYCDFFSRKPPCPPVFDVDADAGLASPTIAAIEPANAGILSASATVATACNTFS